MTDKLGPLCGRCPLLERLEELWEKARDNRAKGKTGGKEGEEAERHPNLILKPTKKRAIIVYI